MESWKSANASKKLKKEEKPPPSSPSLPLRKLEIIDDYIGQQSTHPSKEVTALSQTMTASTFFFVKKNTEVKHPIKNRPAADYEIVKANPSRSCHKTDQVKKINSKKKNNPIRFFKYNSEDSLMSELEAFCCAVFSLIAPDHAPAEPRAHYKGEKYTGISTIGIPGFEPLKKNKLLESHLSIKCLENRTYTIPELDRIEIIARRNGYDLENMPDAQKIWEDEKGVVTVLELRNYSIVKGLGIGLATSHALGEADCHILNISKYGERIDFDMLLWWILYHFKEAGLINWAIRFPNDKTFIVTAYDILHSPNFKDTDLFYWPAQKTKSVSLSVATMFSLSQNAYSAEDNRVFQLLENHDVYIYHKYATYLKFTLTTATIYSNLAKLFVRDNIIFENKNMIEVLGQTLQNRVNEFKNVLLQMPEFFSFLKTVDPASNKNYRDIIMQNIKTQFETRNAKWSSKIHKHPEYREQIISGETIQRHYDTIFNEDIEKIADEFSVVDDEKSTIGINQNTFKTWVKV